MNRTSIFLLIVSTALAFCSNATAQYTPRSHVDVPGGIATLYFDFENTLDSDNDSGSMSVTVTLICPPEEYSIFEIELERSGISFSGGSRFKGEFDIICDGIAIPVSIHVLQSRRMYPRRGALERNDIETGGRLVDVLGNVYSISEIW